MPNLVDLAAADDKDSSGYSTELVLEVQEEVQETFDEILKSVDCIRIRELNCDMFENLDKETVVDWLVDTLNILRKGRNLLADAAGEIDALQREAILDKSSIIQLQREAIDENRKELKAVQTTIQTEIKSYRDAVSSQSVVSSATYDREKFTIDDVKEAVKSVRKDDERNRNVMIFGLKEDQEDLKACVTKVFQQMDQKPIVDHCERLGNKRYGSSNQPRPIKVTLASSVSVEATLRRRHLLRKDPFYNSVYLAPDRSPEERREHKDLVDAMKVKIAKEPEFYHHIRDHQILSSPRRKSPGKELSPEPPR